MSKQELKYIMPFGVDVDFLVLYEILAIPCAFNYINILVFLRYRQILLMKLLDFYCFRNVEIFDITLYLFINSAFNSEQILNNIESESPFPVIDLNNLKIIRDSTN